MNAKTNEYRVDIASEWRNVLKTPANLHLLSTQLSVLCAMAEADATARAEAAEAERDALRERCIEWLPFNEAAETIDSILVWREDAGVFVAFYADEQECWFTSFGEDLTGDLPTFYAKMPQGPTSK